MVTLLRRSRTAAAVSGARSPVHPVPIGFRGGNLIGYHAGGSDCGPGSFATLHPTAMHTAGHPCCEVVTP